MDMEWVQWMDAKTKVQTIKTFYLIYTLFGLSYVLIDPLIPVIAEEINVGFDKIGIALFVGSMATLISNFIIGRLSDRVDIKKLILLGLILIFIGFIVFGLYLNYLLFVIILISIRVGFGTLETALRSFTVKLFKKNVSRVFLNLDIGWYSGAFLGPLIISAVLFFDFLPRYVFFITAFIYLVCIIIFYRICPKKKIITDDQSIKTKNQASKRKGFASLKDPVVIISGLALFFYMGGIMGLSTWFTTYFLDLGIEVSYSSAILSLYWFFSIIGMVITTRIVSRFKEITLLFIGCITGTVCLALFSFIPNVYIKIVFLAILAIFFSVIFPLTTAISSQRDKENSGTILGFVIALTFASSIVFQPIFGYVAEYLGKSNIVFVSLSGAIIGLIFISILFRILKRKPQKALIKN
jgi:fucose permease